MALSLASEISENIAARAQFSSEYARLIELHLRSRLGFEASRLDIDAAARLLQSALLFASTTNEELRYQAFRIAAALSDQEYVDRIIGGSAVTELVLTRLSNWPALGTMQNQAAQRPAFDMPTTIERLYSASSAKVFIDDSRSITLTSFQRRLWDNLSSGQSVSISAPTSAGKSFLLHNFLLHTFFVHGPLNVAYIVPSRALISQVSTAFGVKIREAGSDVAILTAPLEMTESIPQRALLVMTPERLQLLMENHPELSVSILVVDEAQTIGSGARGITLTAVVEELLRRNPDAQTFFAAPYAENPGVFGTALGLNNLQSESTGEPAVVQHIVYLDFIKRSIHVSYESAAGRANIGQREMGKLPTTQEGRMALSASTFGNGEKNLIYAKGPAQAESTALAIAELRNATSTAVQQDLSDLAKKAIHPEYALARTVLAGVAFHYGNVPALIRKSVEDLFSGPELTDLVTTSTLLHGVNLPARNIFIHRPYAGTKQMTPVEFWNLAGRAGRLGLEQEGFVYVIDYDQWPVKPISAQDRKQHIKPSLTEAINDGSEELIKVMNAPEFPDGEGRNVYVSAFNKLFTDYRLGRLDGTLEKSNIKENSALRVRYEKTLARISDQIRLSAEQLKKNPTISVYRQQRLYDEIEKAIIENKIQAMLPVYPMQGDAWPNLDSIINTLHRVLQDKQDNAHRFFATLALQWIRGENYPKMIDEYFKYQKKSREARGEKYELKTAIRDLLDEVDDGLRFKYVRFISCYLNLMRHALEAKGMEGTASAIPPLDLYLELGACERTAISLQAIGISRIGANQLIAHAPARDLGVAEVRRWLLSGAWQGATVSRFVAREVREVLGELKRGGEKT